MRVKLLIAVFAVLTTVSSFALALVLFSGEEPQIEETFYPEKLNHRFLLNTEEKGVESHIEYYKDDFTRVVAEIKYKNGNIKYLHYREKLQTISKIVDYHMDEATGQPRLVAESYLTKDGEKLSKHLTYREDGTLERKGERQADGKYKTTVYAPDGIAISIVKLFDKREVLFEEKGFYPDGTDRFSTEWNISHLETKSYRKDGTLVSIVENHHGFQRGLFYREDGKTPRASFSKNSEIQELIYFDDKQNPTNKVTYYSDRIEVAFVKGGRIVYTQTLIPLDRSSTISHCAGNNRLLKVAELSETSIMPYQQVIERLFILSDKGKTPTQVIVAQKDQTKTIYHLNADGIVVGIEYEGRKNSEDGEPPPPNRYKEGEKVDYDIDMLVIKNFKCVDIPEKIEVPQTRIFTY